MDWNAIGAIGETIGAAAVVVSLLYLAVQIREQNKQARPEAECRYAFTEIDTASAVKNFFSRRLASVSKRNPS